MSGERGRFHVHWHVATHRRIQATVSTFGVKRAGIAYEYRCRCGHTAWTTGLISQRLVDFKPPGDDPSAWRITA